MLNLRRAFVEHSFMFALEFETIADYVFKLVCHGVVYGIESRLILIIGLLPLFIFSHCSEEILSCIHPEKLAWNRAN